MLIQSCAEYLMNEPVPMVQSDSSGSEKRTSWSLAVDPSIYYDVEQTLTRLQQILSIDYLALLVPSVDGQEFWTVSSVGLDPELARRFCWSPKDEPLQQLQSDGSPFVIQDGMNTRSISPLSQVPGIGALTIVPLTLDGKLRGLLHLGQKAGESPSRIDSSMLSLAEHTMALAVDRAELRRAETSARQVSVSTRERLTFLAIASGLLSSSLDYETTLSQITGMLVPRLADVCAVVLLDTDDSINQVTVDSTSPDVTRQIIDLQSRYSLAPGAHSAARQVLDSGKTQFHPNITDEYYIETATNAEHAELLKTIGMRSMVIVPLSGHGATIGALSLAFLGDRRFSVEDVDFLEDLAHRAALAVENARLFTDVQRALQEREEALQFREETLQLERIARARAEAAQRREAFLSEASSVLSASLDSGATLENLARLVVDRAADWMTIELFDSSGLSSLVAAAHQDPDGDAVIQQIRQEYIPVTIPELPPRHVLRYREAVMVNELPDDFWFDTASSPQHLLLLDRLETRSLIIVPLFTRQRALGVMIMARSAGAAEFDDEDLPMAVDLGYRVALSLENSLLYQNAQRVLQQQEEFISTASHELKTPLTTVKGYLQLINRQLHREDHSPARLVRFTRELDVQVRRLEELVSDLLDVSRIQQGRLELRFEEFDLSELAEEILARFEHATERLPEHELTISTSGPVHGTWDRGRLDQVLTNLISNALKYSPDGGQVLVRVKKTNEMAQITVRDNGIGIGLDERSRVFQPFSRGRNAKQNIAGTGLGLYITQRIVHNHHGEIYVKSDPGQGTTFIVQLPLQSSTDAGQIGPLAADPPRRSL